MSETLVIREASTLKALADPTRLEILMEVAERPRTVKEVAAILGGSATRLYYHFKILERAGLIRVTERRMVSGIEERTYGATAESWTPAPEAAGSTLVESGVIDAVLELVRAELELALGAQSDAPLGDVASPVPIISFTRLALSEDDIEKLQNQWQQVMLDHIVTGAEIPEGKRVYHALFAGYAAPAQLNERQRGSADAAQS